jgi:hypothetical protein
LVALNLLGPGCSTFAEDFGSFGMAVFGAVEGSFAPFEKGSLVVGLEGCSFDSGFAVDSHLGPDLDHNVDLVGNFLS